MAPFELQGGNGVSSGPIRLSPLENLLCLVYDRFSGEGTGAMVMKVRGRIEAEPLRIALSSLQRRHPKLRARVVKSADGQRCFELADPPPPIPVEMRDYDAEPLPWMEETHRRFSEKMDVAAGPLARMLILRTRSGESCYAILLAHHAIYDGLSLLHAVDDLWRYYEAAEQGGDTTPVVSLPFVSCPRARPTGSLLGRLGVLARQVRMRRARSRKRWTSLPRLDRAPARPQWDVRVFSVQETMALVRRCRQENTSLDGALFAAAVSALKASLPQSESRFKLRFPIDIRAQLEGPAGPVTPADLGCFVTVFDNIYSVGTETAFWPMARQVHQDVRSFIAAGGPSLLYNLARFVRPRTSPQRRHRGTVHSSVIGVAPLERRYGRLTLEECAQVYKNDLGGASINLVAIILQLRLNLTMHASDLEEELWRRFRDEIVAQLRSAIDDRRPEPAAVAEAAAG